MSDIIAGLDLSTSVAGYCTMDEDANIKEWGFYKFDKPDGYALIDLVEQWSENVWPHIEHADKIILEDSLKKYAGGFSSKATISKLLRFNGIVEYELQKRKGKGPIEKIHPSTAKKQSFLNRGRVPSSYESPWSTYKDSKAWVIQRVNEHFDEFTIDYTHSDNPRPGTDDICDSLVLASSYVNNQV